MKSVMDRSGRPRLNTSRVIAGDDGIGHYVDSPPTGERHGRTACSELWDIGPCTNVVGTYVPTMNTVDQGGTCLECLMAEAERG